MSGLCVLMIFWKVDLLLVEFTVNTQPLKMDSLASFQGFLSGQSCYR